MNVCTESLFGTRLAIEQFQIGSTLIKCEDNVTLLRVNIDCNLNFHDYVSDTVGKHQCSLVFSND